MKIVDLSHVMNVHTPGWVGYAGNKMYYAQNLQTQMIVAQRIDTALHVGTHFDGAMHATDNRKGDMASLPLEIVLANAFSKCRTAVWLVCFVRRDPEVEQCGAIECQAAVSWNMRWDFAKIPSVQSARCWHG